MKSVISRALARAKVTLLSAGAVLSLGAASVAVTPAPAHASATGCTRWGNVSIFGISVPTGQYCFTIQGSGLKVTGTIGSFNTPQIGYPSERVSFYDTKGNRYASYNTYSASGNIYGYKLWSTKISGTAKVGHVCGELMSYGAVIAKACHNIKP